MRRRTWRADLPLVVALVFHITQAAVCQPSERDNTSFSALVESAVGGSQLKTSVSLDNTRANISGNVTISGAFGVWMFLPSDAGVVRLEAGSKLQLSNLGIGSGVKGVPDITAILALPYFDMDRAATLVLRNVSMNLNCGDLTALQSSICNSMPDTRFEVFLWSLRVVSLATPNLVAENVTLRCGPSATNSTATVTYMGSDVGNDPDNTKITISDPSGFPCVAVLVYSYLDFLRPWATYSGTQPQAHYLMVMANLSTADLTFARPRAFAPKYRVNVLVTGRPDVPTQLDLRSHVNVISLLDSGNDFSNPTSVEFRDITLVNLEYGPATQYPVALVTAALWFLEYRRAGFGVTFIQSPVRVTMTRVTFVVSEVELRWWSGLVRGALSTNATGVDPDMLIRYYSPGLTVADDGDVWVPYWEWVYGMISWTNCSLTSTPLREVPANRLAARPDLLDTLRGYGQDEPVPLSAIRLARDQLDATFFSSKGSSAILPLDAQLWRNLTGSKTTVGANLTIWGDGRGLRYLDMQALQGAVTVPPNTVLALKFVNIINLAVGPGSVDPLPLQNYTFMMWAFNRTLLPVSGAVRRTAMSITTPQAHKRALRTLDARDGLFAGHSISPSGRVEAGRTMRRHLAQDRPTVGSSTGSDGGSSSSSVSGGSIPLGPFRPWLRLENVDLFVPAVEVQLVYDILKGNRTSLRVSAAVVDWLRVTLATAQVRTVTNERVEFISFNWLGIEGINVSIDGRTPTTPPFTILQSTASILLPESPSPPTSRTPLSSSPVVLYSPPPNPTPQQRPTNKVSVSPPPPMAPASYVVLAAVAAVPAAQTPIGSIVGPAVGSAAGLLLLCGLVAFIIVYLRHRRRQAALAYTCNETGQDKNVEGSNGADGRNHVAAAGTSERRGSNCRSPGEAGNRQLPPPSSPARAVHGRLAAVAGTERGIAVDAGLGKIQPATDDGAIPGVGPTAVAAPGGSGSGKQASGLPPRALTGHNPKDVHGRRGALRHSGNGDGGGGLSGPSGPSQQRKSRSSNSAASAGSASKSAACSSGVTSDTVSTNPRTELYAALAAFQTELGEQQQQIAILSQLGAGAHGVVYRGEWRGLEVAVKTLLFQAFVGGNVEDSGNSLKEQAMLEAAIATTLYHPNVINTYSYDIKPLRMCPPPASSTNSSRAETVVSSEGGGIMDWKLYIIQEYCDGGTLKDALDGARFTDPDTGTAFRETAVRIAIEIASGMTYIHARNIIHGDLKPANILLRSSSSSPYGYTAKIADFGLALKLKAGESHISNIRRGTPFYIASELVEDGRATTASDLYSFGVILWELLHGSTVARRLPLRRRIPNLPAEFYTWPPDCPPAYRELATACLSSNPSSRPRFPEALATLSKLLTTLIEARKQEQLRRQQQEKKRHGAAKASTIELGGRGQGQDGESNSGAGNTPASEGCGTDGERGAGVNDAGTTQSSSEVFWAPPLLLGNALLKLEGAKHANSPTRNKHSGGGGGSMAGGNGSGSGLLGSTLQTSSCGGGAGPPGPGRGGSVSGCSPEAVVTAATTTTAAVEHGSSCATTHAAKPGRIAPSACGKPSLEPTPEDAELQPCLGPGYVDAVPVTAKSRCYGHDSTAEAAVLASSGSSAAGGSVQGQAQDYVPFGGARPTTLRALVRSASSAAMEAQEAGPSGAFAAALPVASGRSAVAVQPPPFLPPPQQQHLMQPYPSPAGTDPPSGGASVVALEL